MTASTAASKKSLPFPAQQKAARAGKPISWEAFQRRYLSREDGYKYEWVNGQVEKTLRTMDRTQLYILNNILEHFMKLRITGKVEGQLITEADLFFKADLHRQPDVCWLTTAQINALADPNVLEIPAFLIEVISSKDQINRVRKKLLEYRDAGVQVVWHLFPAYQQVQVYSGARLEHSTVFEGDQLCSAATALPAFEMPVREVFRYPGRGEE